MMPTSPGVPGLQVKRIPEFREASWWIGGSRGRPYTLKLRLYLANNVTQLACLPSSSRPTASKTLSSSHIHKRSVALAYSRFLGSYYQNPPRMPMFSGIAYHLSPSIPPQTRSELQRALNGNGGQEVDRPGNATHIITDTMQFEGWENVPDSIMRVTVSALLLYRGMANSFHPQPRWVLRCLGHDKWQE